MSFCPTLKRADIAVWGVQYSSPVVQSSEWRHLSPSKQSDGSVFTAQVNPLQSRICHTAQRVRVGTDSKTLQCISAAMISRDKKSIQCARVFGSRAGSFLCSISFPHFRLFLHFRFSFSRSYF